MSETLRPTAASSLVASMSGLSANFVYLEREELPLHTLKLFELRVPQRVEEEEVWNIAERVIALLPPLQWRLVRVPGDLHHPQWKRARPDLRKQVRISSEALVSEDDINRITSSLASAPLPVARRVWDITLFRFRDDDTRILLVLRLHHALADGLAAANMLDHVARHWTGDPMPAVPDGAIVQTEGWHSTSLACALARRLYGLSTLPALVVHSLRGWIQAKHARASYQPDNAVPALFDSPSTSLDRARDGRRLYHHFELPFSAVKEVKNAYDCKVGDVILTLVAAGLRTYFSERGEFVSEALVAGVPVALTAEEPTRPRLYGNNLSHMPVSLRSDIEDDVERLHAIAKETEGSKTVHAAFGSELLRAWSELSMRGVLRALFAMTRRFKRPPINLVVSNVHGPDTSIRWGKIELTRIFSVGPVLDRVGLNVTAWSYGDRVAVSMLANAANVADLEPLHRGMADALEGLLGRVRAPKPASLFRVAAGREPDVEASSELSGSGL